MPAGFFNSADGLKDCELKGTLKELIRDHTVIPYGDGSWEVFYYADQDENGYCMDMYCDEWKKFGSPGSAVSGCNVEHSFAKSWWGGAKNDAYKDCYHLNPSNATANSARSNYPLGNVTNLVKTAGSLKIGKQHHDALDTDFFIWEPKDEYKGDFARAYFYMATCYGKDKNGNYDPTICSAYQGWRLDNKDVGSRFAMQNDNYLEFQPWEQEVLIAWHRRDPVSEKEIKRADAVSDFQHNRNPFIDYPYLAEYIWGSMAGKAVEMEHLVASSDSRFVPGVSNGWDGESTPLNPDEPVVKYGVAWSVCGSVLRVDSIVENKNVTAMPDKPTSCSEESNIFMGWSDRAISGTTNTRPAVLYQTLSDFPSITRDMTFYAVFAHSESTTEEATGDVLPTYLITMSKQGFASGAVVSAIQTDEVTITFDKGSNSNAPKYYSSGEAVRVYGGGTMTVTSEPMARIDLTFGQGDNSNEITVNTGYYDAETAQWHGEASEVKFTVGGSSGHRKIAAVEVFPAGGEITVTSYSRYITSCSGEQGMKPTSDSSLKGRATKVLVGGQLYILVNDALFTITGQKIK